MVQVRCTDKVDHQDHHPLLACRDALEPNFWATVPNWQLLPKTRNPTAITCSFLVPAPTSKLPLQRQQTGDDVNTAVNCPLQQSECQLTLQQSPTVGWTPPTRHEAHDGQPDAAKKRCGTTVLRQLVVVPALLPDRAQTPFQALCLARPQRPLLLFPFPPTRTKTNLSTTRTATATATATLTTTTPLIYPTRTQTPHTPTTDTLAAV